MKLYHCNTGNIKYAVFICKVCSIPKARPFPRTCHNILFNSRLSQAYVIKVEKLKLPVLVWLPLSAISPFSHPLKLTSAGHWATLGN